MTTLWRLDGGGAEEETPVHRMFIELGYKVLRQQRDEENLDVTDEECYWAAISSVGYECDHPVRFRMVLPFPTRPPRWDGMIDAATLDEYECGVCHGYVMRGPEARP